jgi:hypothetical protein
MKVMYIIITLARYIAKMIKEIFTTNIYFFGDKIFHFSNKEIGKYFFYNVNQIFLGRNFPHIANYFFNLVNIYCFFEFLVAKFRKKYN